MGLFNKKDSNLLDIIRCDEPSYLIWKWYPSGSQARNNKRVNSIRWGSSLRVKDGEVAVFVYSNINGFNQDYIVGPYDKFIKTRNFPVLTSIMGAGYGGDSPFQAEIYFINLAKIIQSSFVVPYFDLYDYRFQDFGVPTAVRGTITFSIKDYREFIKLHQLNNFDLNQFNIEIKAAVSRYVKGIVAKTVIEKSIPVVQIEREMLEINSSVESYLSERLNADFGVYVSGVDIQNIELDKSSASYQELKRITIDITTETVEAQSKVNIKNMEDTQRINAENMEETLRIQREESQYAKRKQTQSSNFAAFQLEQQTSVGIAGAQALGEMSSNGATDVSSGGMNPAGMMVGMAMGGAVGQNVAGMMNGMMSGINGTQSNYNNPQQNLTPPPVPSVKYYVALNGNATGPFDIDLIRQMVIQGVFTKESLVWKSGMENWIKANEVQELTNVFENSSDNNISEIPPIPPVL